MEIFLFSVASSGYMETDGYGHRSFSSERVTGAIGILPLIEVETLSRVLK